MFVEIQLSASSQELTAHRSLYKDRIHWNPSCAYPYAKAKKITKYIEERYSSVRIYWIPIPKYDQYLLDIQFADQDDIATWEFCLISNNRLLEI